MKMPKTVLDHYSYGKALADLDSTRKELEEVNTECERLIKDQAYITGLYNEKCKELAALTGKMRRLSDKWNDESNEIAVQLSADIKQQKIELQSKCNTLRRCCDELCAAVKSKGNGAILASSI